MGNMDLLGDWTMEADQTLVFLAECILSETEVLGDLVRGYELSV